MTMISSQSRRSKLGTYVVCLFYLLKYLQPCNQRLVLITATGNRVIIQWPKLGVHAMSGNAHLPRWQLMNVNEFNVAGWLAPRRVTTMHDTKYRLSSLFIRTPKHFCGFRHRSETLYTFHIHRATSYVATADLPTASVIFCLRLHLLGFDLNVLDR